MLNMLLLTANNTTEVYIIDLLIPADPLPSINTVNLFPDFDI